MKGQIFNSTNVLFKDLLLLNDKLREDLRDFRGLQISQVVVVGDQSHGKTSLIERLTQFDLPKGQGIQTRAPIEIRVKKIPKTQEKKTILRYKSKAKYEDVLVGEDDLQQ